MTFGVLEVGGSGKTGHSEGIAEHQQPGISMAVDLLEVYFYVHACL